MPCRVNLADMDSLRRQPQDANTPFFNCFKSSEPGMQTVFPHRHAASQIDFLPSDPIYRVAVR
jgi:hypothetical protein